MTAAQKKNVERFKKAAAEAKKLRKKNPKLTQAQAVKQAFAILYKTGKVAGAKKTATKKPARKKATAKSYHKDTKSHNVRISVVSGVKFSKDEIEFLQKEGQRSKGYVYRGKILWGAPIVLKSTKSGTPIQKFYVDNLDIANELSKELNKGQKYTKVKAKKHIK